MTHFNDEMGGMYDPIGAMKNMPMGDGTVFFKDQRVNDSDNINKRKTGSEILKEALECDDYGTANKYYKLNEGKLEVDGTTELWVVDRILQAVKMGIALEKEKKEYAKSLYTRGVAGVINGCAIEIIKILGKNPSYKFLNKRE